MQALAVVHILKPSVRMMQEDIASVIGSSESFTWKPLEARCQEFNCRVYGCRWICMQMLVGFIRWFHTCDFGDTKKKLMERVLAFQIWDALIHWHSEVCGKATKPTFSETNILCNLKHLAKVKFKMFLTFSFETWIMLNVFIIQMSFYMTIKCTFNCMLYHYDKICQNFGF